MPAIVEHRCLSVLRHDDYNPGIECSFPGTSFILLTIIEIVDVRLDLNGTGESVSIANGGKMVLLGTYEYVCPVPSSGRSVVIHHR